MAAALSLTACSTSDQVSLGRFAPEAAPQAGTAAPQAGMSAPDPIADAIKLIQKEVLQPRASDAKLFNLPPILVFIPAMLTFAVFAWAPDLVYADLNVGVLYLLALSSVTSLAIFIAGWASNNKYALLGAMRVIAMAISYEIPMVLALLALSVLPAPALLVPQLSKAHITDNAILEIPPGTVNNLWRPLEPILPVVLKPLYTVPLLLRTAL